MKNQKSAKRVQHKLPQTNTNKSEGSAKLHAKPAMIHCKPAKEQTRTVMIDSGASVHMFMDPDDFTDLKSIAPKKVALGDE